MASLLRQVLLAFENNRGPRSLAQLAADLEVSPGVLEGMIAYWVRKGRLREVNSGPACNTCGSANGCPFVIKLPRAYELVSEDSPVVLPSAACPHQP